MKQDGFTLLEILVALAILAVALSAAIRASSAAIQTAGDLRQRVLAGWVAENRLAELRALRVWPATGVSEGEVEMVGERLQWRQTVTATPNVRFRRLEVAVVRPGDEAGAALVRQISYLTQP
jgi:general secretion pathway protein I